MIKEDGTAATLEEFFTAHAQKKITAKQLKKLKSNIDEGDSGEWFEEGPPCMQALSKFGVEKKVRNETLLDMTRYIKMRYPEDWKDKVGEYNKKIFMPPMDYDEVKNVIGSREKKDYRYRCDKDWLKPHCDRDKCIHRKFGVGGGETTELILGPLSYVKSTPTIWYLGFNGDEVRLSSKEIVKQDLAREAATEQRKKTPPKIKNWDDQIRGLQGKATPIDAPEESQPAIQLDNFIQSYCFNSRRTTEKKNILFGRPFHEEKGPVRFTFEPFYKFLKTNDWEINKDLTHQMLKKINGVSREKFHITADVKRWVYVINPEEIKKEIVKHDDLDFGQEEESPY
mgnify:FL=1